MHLSDQVHWSTIQKNSGELPEVMKLTPKQLQALSGGGLKEKAVLKFLKVVGSCLEEIGDAIHNYAKHHM